MQLGRRRFPMRQDQAPVAVAKARGRRRGERPSRGGSTPCETRTWRTSGAPVVSDFIRDFESVFSGGSALDDSRPPAPKAAAAASSARSGPPTLTI